MSLFSNNPQCSEIVFPKPAVRFSQMPAAVEKLFATIRFSQKTRAALQHFLLANCICSDACRRSLKTFSTIPFSFWLLPFSQRPGAVTLSPSFYKSNSLVFGCSRFVVFVSLASVDSGCTDCQTMIVFLTNENFFNEVSQCAVFWLGTECEQLFEFRIS